MIDEIAYRAAMHPARLPILLACSVAPQAMDDLGLSETEARRHLAVLEEAGLVRTEKVWRVRTCRVGTRRLEESAAWIETYQQLWDARFAELDKVIEALKQQEQPK